MKERRTKTVEACTILAVAFLVVSYSALCALAETPNGSTSDLTIVSAYYGTPSRYKDVTDILRKKIGGDLSNVIVQNTAFGADPVPGTRKHVQIHYRIGGWTDTKKFFEGERVRLQMPKRLREISAGGGLLILEAEFGVPGRYWDVTAIVQAMVNGSHLDANLGIESYLMDPAPGIDKHTKIRYRFDGKQATVRVDEGKRVQLGTPADPVRAGARVWDWISPALQWALIGLAAALPILLWRAGVWQLRVVVSSIVFVVFGSAMLLLKQPIIEPSHAFPNRPVQERSDGYVQSRACKACHPSEYASWHKSFHRTMTQLARPENMLDTSESIEIEGPYGDLYRIERQDDELWGVHIPDPHHPQKHERHHIALLTGSHHMQIPWLETGEHRRLIMFPYAFLTREQRWAPYHALFLDGNLKPPPKDRFGVGTGRWNQTCLQCHTTQGRSRTDAQGRMDTRVAEMGIACETCHGAGEEHVALNRSPTRRYEHHFGETTDDTIVNPVRLAHKRGSEVCGQCHSIFEPRDALDRPLINWLGHSYRPGDRLEDSRILETYRRDKTGKVDYSGQFWPDKMIRITGREYTAFQGNPCFKAGALSCMSCHQLHAPTDGSRDLDEWRNDLLKFGMRGNLACTQCHEEYAEDLTRHTHHPPDSSGSNCMNCHMPHTTYGVLSAIRSHQIDEPSVQSTIETGRPNACNLCHLDQTLDWTARHLEQWYEIPRPQLSKRHQEVAGGPLWLLTGDAGQRALAAWSAGWAAAREASGSEWMTPYLATLLEDPYYAVRVVSWRSLQDLAAADGLAYHYVAPPAQRKDTQRQVLERWAQQKRKSVPHGSQLLLRPDGSLDRQRFDSLLQDRDDRLIYLLE